MAEPIIEAEGLLKRFGKVQALSGLDLIARGGEVTAVLGPNGAGKTTFVRTIATLVRPDAGKLRVAGIDAARHPGLVRRIIGLAGQYAAVDPALTGRENLYMVARLYGQTRQQATANTASMLDQLGLDDVAEHPVKTYSGGMRRRLDLGASLVARPACCCSTSPPQGSTRAAEARCGKRSEPWWPRARTCASRLSTLTRPTTSPTRWRSSTTAGSSPMARRLSSRRWPGGTSSRCERTARATYRWWHRHWHRSAPTNPTST
jgi:ABC-type transport system involved in cytochrome c biogenesis ATPase subunit